MVPLPLPRISGLEKTMCSHKLLEGPRWFSCIKCGLATVPYLTFVPFPLVGKVVKILTFPAVCEKLPHHFCVKWPRKHFRSGGHQISISTKPWSPQAKGQSQVIVIILGKQAV